MLKETGLGNRAMKGAMCTAAAPPTPAYRDITREYEV